MAPQMSSQLPIYPTPSRRLFTHKTPSFLDTVTSESDDTNLYSGNPESVIFSVLCMFDFSSSETGLLSFRKNEILDIIKCTEGWWAATRKEGSTLGWIPPTFVKPLSQEMTERLQDIRQELRGCEYERLQELYHSAQDSAHFPVFSDGSAPRSSISKSQGLTNLRDHSGELDIRKGQNQIGSPHCPSRSRLSSTTTTRYRCLTRSASTHINPPSPQPKGTADDSRIRAGSLSIRSPRRHPVIVDDDVTLSQLSTLIRSTNLKQIDNLTTNTSFRSLSNAVQEEVTEAGDCPFGFISDAANKEIQRARVQEKVIGGPVINIGHPGTPWYLRSQYADQLEVDDKGNVRSGTLLSLFEMLTSDSGASDTKPAQFRTFTNVFLMTFRTFTTADHLFDMLVERFHLEPKNSLTGHEYMDWKANFRKPVQRLVLEVFSQWLENYGLVEEEPHIAQRLKNFLALIVSPPHNTTATIIIQAIDRLTSTNPVLVAKHFSPNKPRKFKINKLDLFRLDTKNIAEQLTVYEFGLYVKITPQQCLTYVKIRTGVDVAKLRDFCSTHDKLGAWVKMSILNSDGTGKRAHAIDFWIKIAEKCRALNNISSMSAIITALSSTVITQLQLSWAHTSRKSALDELLRYSEPTGGFAGYRSLLQQAEGPCVPFITMFLTEMAHVQDQFSETEGRISFYQRTRWYETITTMLRFQSRPYNIAVNAAIINFIEAHLREGSCCDPSWFWKKSQETQKAEVTHADIRKGLEDAGF